MGLNPLERIRAYACLSIRRSVHDLSSKEQMVWVRFGDEADYGLSSDDREVQEKICSPKVSNGVRSWFSDPTPNILASAPTPYIEEDASTEILKSSRPSSISNSSGSAQPLEASIEHQSDHNEASPVPLISNLNTHPMTARGKSRVSKPNPRYALLSTDISTEPSSIKAALSHDG
ncbi:hypothetical protein NE237_002095 [Protea cynaroides]|uniref:Uncharacterized protein n=1 Tax=Protea cynaroides TaxID=273540 RepID=A0A9Q0KVF7_9MAGN|nr:hypothetical protein NE237_002095 [Protea cynaroides]